MQINLLCKHIIYCYFINVLHISVTPILYTHFYTLHAGNNYIKRKFVIRTVVPENCDESIMRALLSGIC